MKLTKLFLLLLFFTAMPVAHSTPDNSTVSVPSKVTLKGELEKIKSRSPLQPVEVIQSATGLYIGFMYNLGTLSIKITDVQNGTVYAGSVDTDTVTGVTVSTGNWAQGIYHLQITDRQGGCLEGYFNVIF